MLTGRVPTVASKTNEKRQWALSAHCTWCAENSDLFLGFKSAKQTSTFLSQSHLLSFEHIFPYATKNLFTNAQSLELVFQLLEKTGFHIFNHIKFGNFFHSESESKDF